MGFVILFSICILNRIRDEEAGDIPVAFVMMKPGAEASESSIIDFVAKEVRISICNPKNLYNVGCKL
ncbi:hypothetical protein Hdeb2414_s0119g00802391 [Helianthus debilis subsp. tardiflorus]